MKITLHLTSALWFQPLDFEKKRQYSLRVQVENVHINPRFYKMGPFRDEASVRITVDDVDEPPLFERPSYVMEVREDAGRNAIIGSVSAADPDDKRSLVRCKNDTNVCVLLRSVRVGLNLHVADGPPNRLRQNICMALINRTDGEGRGAGLRLDLVADFFHFYDALRELALKVEVPALYCRCQTRYHSLLPPSSRRWHLKLHRGGAGEGLARRIRRLY